MIALDTNLIVYAHRADSPFHDLASALLSRLVASGDRWGIPWPCVHEFIAVVSHPRIYKQPTPIAVALEAIRSLQTVPTLELIGEGEGYLDCLAALAEPARIAGGAIHDARIAAICKYHGISELWSADRDFSRFPHLKVRNPLVSRS